MESSTSSKFSINSPIMIISAGVVIALLVSGILWLRSQQANDPNVISRGGIHWHPSLSIYVKGQQIQIPSELGIGTHYEGASGYDLEMQMAAMHTHKDLPIVHLEFMGGPVRTEDVTLG